MVIMALRPDRLMFLSPDVDVESDDSITEFERNHRELMPSL